MAAEWRSSTWGEEISLEYGKALRGHDDEQGRYRVFGANGPISWTSQPLVAGPGVILGRKGAYRGVQFSRDPFFVIDTAYYVVPKRELNMRWLYYAIIQYKLGEVDDGSPIPSTTRAAVYVLDLDVPPLDEQRAIAHILGRLDDKIELNRRMNETLEEIARAIFKSWFVDFDPVRAKAAGCDPGLPKHIADLFPDSFEDSELGEIPKGWKVWPLAKLATKISKGTTPTNQDISSALDGPQVPFLKVKDISDTGDVSRDALEKIPTSIHQGVLKRSILQTGDLLFSIAGTIGRVAVVEQDLSNSNTNQAVAFVRLKDATAHFGLCLYHLKSERIQESARALIVQGVQANVSLASVGSFQILLPSDEILDVWNRLFNGIIQNLRVIAAQSRALAALRDTLLPKLISGGLRIKDAERFTGEVMA